MNEQVIFEKLERIERLLQKLISPIPDMTLNSETENTRKKREAIERFNAKKPPERHIKYKPIRNV